MLKRMTFGAFVRGAPRRIHAINLNRTLVRKRVKAGKKLRYETNQSSSGFGVASRRVAPLIRSTSASTATATATACNAPDSKINHIHNFLVFTRDNRFKNVVTLDGFIIEMGPRPFGDGDSVMTSYPRALKHYRMHFNSALKGARRAVIFQQDKQFVTRGLNYQKAPFFAEFMWKNRFY